MAAVEPWLLKLRSRKNKNKNKPSFPTSPLPDQATTTTIGILSFEVASAMSRAVHLHRSLSDSELSRLRSLTLPFISTLDPHLLAMAEKLDDLNRIAAATSRLGRRCAHPALNGFEHVYSDLLAGRITDPSSLGFLSKDMDGTVRRMDRLVSSTSNLYAELEALTDLEQTAKKYPPATATRQTLDQKIQWQRHDIKLLRDASLWNKPFDKAILLLARAVCTIHARIFFVFGESAAGLDSLFPAQVISVPRRHIPIHSGQISGPIDADVDSEGSVQNNTRLHCASNPGRLLMDCLSLSSSAFENESWLPRTGAGGLVPVSGKIEMPRFSPKSSLLSLAPASTVGGSALALHYANVIIITEKLLRYPHLVGEEARDDLYQMLSSSIRTALRRSLKSYAKNMAIYDASLAHDWKEAMDKILSWLAPMAHNMIRWQTERNFEQQQIVSRANVLLLETLYFADRVKTEGAICELLVGLNYICRYEHQQNALMDCRSSADFGECVDWQLQY